MMSYVTAFIFYTLAMIGVLLVGFVVYKKTFLIDKKYGKGLIKVLDSLPIGNKKNLLVVKINNEKFLIAADVERTTFLSKLETSDENELTEIVPKTELSKIDKILAEEKNNARRQPRFDDLSIPKHEQLQQQFKDLYDEEAQEDLTPKEKLQRQVLIKKFLKNLNSDIKSDDWSKI